MENTEQEIGQSALEANKRYLATIELQKIMHSIDAIKLKYESLADESVIAELNKAWDSVYTSYNKIKHS